MLGVVRTGGVNGNVTVTYNISSNSKLCICSHVMCVVYAFLP